MKHLNIFTKLGINKTLRVVDLAEIILDTQNEIWLYLIILIWSKKAGVGKREGTWLTQQQQILAWGLASHLLLSSECLSMMTVFISWSLQSCKAYSLRI